MASALPTSYLPQAASLDKCFSSLRGHVVHPVHQLWKAVSRGSYTPPQYHSRLVSAVLMASSRLGHPSLEFLLPLSLIVPVITGD